MQGISNQEYRTTYQAASARRVLLVTDAPAGEVLMPGRPGHTLFLSYAFVSLTAAAAASIQLEDTAGTPVVLAALPASAPVGPHAWTFGEEGVALTEGAGLALRVSGAGNAAVIVAQGYFLQTTPLSIEQFRTA